MPRATNVEHYAAIVKEKSTLRALITSAHDILQEAYAGAEDADEILDGAEKRIFEVADKRIRTGFIPIADLVQGSFDTLSKLQQHRGLVSGVPTGFTELDEMTAGLQPGDLVIIAARPSMGKTSFVLNIAQHVALNRERSMTVGFFSLEMSAQQLFIRLLTAEARIDAHRLRSGYLSADDYAKLVKAVGTLESAKIFIDDTASIGVLEMRAKARRLKSEHGLDLLIVDYIQLMQGRGRFDNRQQELASISRSLKGLAKELSVPILVLSQLSRAPEARSDRRPQLSDLRESGALEQDADVVMMIFRPGVYEKDNPDLQNVAEIIIAKQRNGPDRHGQPGLPEPVHAVREHRTGHGVNSYRDCPADLCPRRSRRALPQLPHAGRLRRQCRRRRRPGRRSAGCGEKARRHRRGQGQRLRPRRGPRRPRPRGGRRLDAGLRRHRRRRPRCARAASPSRS